MFTSQTRLARVCNSSTRFLQNAIMVGSETDYVFGTKYLWTEALAINLIVLEIRLKQFQQSVDVDQLKNLI